MRIVTFQEKTVLEELILNRTSKVFECTTQMFESRFEGLYNRMLETMKAKLALPENRQFVPIWGWVISKKTEINDAFLDELYNRHAIHSDRLVALELEVPKEFLVVSNFDVWNELLFKATFKQDITDEEYNELFVKKQGAILQVAMPFIAVDFVKSYKDYNDYTKRDYSNTDALVKKEMSKGDIITDETGNYIIGYKN